MAAIVSPALSLRGLTKFYGTTLGVEDVSFDVGAGEVVGFLGPNGSGKTTVLRMVTGLIGITRGTVELFGSPVGAHAHRLRNFVGYLPGTLGLYQNQTVGEYLAFMAHMRGSIRINRADELCARLGLDKYLRINGLSKGTKQKVGVVQAFMHDPPLLLLDEPTSGLDPLVQREFEVILREAASGGAAILLSSHVLAEVEQMASRVAVLDRGHLVTIDDVASLKKRTAHTVDFYFDGPVDPSPFARCPGVSSATARDNTVSCIIIGPQTELLSLAASLGATRVLSPEPTLEEIFFSLTKGRDRV